MSDTDPVPDDESLEWNLEERDEALETGELTDDAPAPVDVIVGEDD